MVDAVLATIGNQYHEVQQALRCSPGRGLNRHMMVAVLRCVLKSLLDQVEGGRLYKGRQGAMGVGVRGWLGMLAGCAGGVRGVSGLGL